MRGMSARALCVRCILSSPAVSFFSLQECLCALCACVCASWLPGGGPVGWQSCPVAVTVPGAASGTIWPLWKILRCSSMRACMQKENQRDDDALRTARAVGTRHSRAMKQAKSQFAVHPGRGLEAHKSSHLKTTGMVKYTFKQYRPQLCFIGCSCSSW